MQSLLASGQSFGAICVLIGSKCVDVIRGRIVIRLRVSAKAGTVGSARFANDYMLRGAGVDLWAENTDFVHLAECIHRDCSIASRPLVGPGPVR